MGQLKLYNGLVGQIERLVGKFPTSLYDKTRCGKNSLNCVLLIVTWNMVYGHKTHNHINRGSKSDLLAVNKVKSFVNYVCTRV